MRMRKLSGALEQDCTRTKETRDFAESISKKFPHILFEAYDEKRSGIERRSGLERRRGVERRSGKERRAASANR